MKNGDTIKDIVRRGQLLLCDLERTAIWHIDLASDWAIREKHYKTGTFPKSLGELCLEIAQPKLFLLKSTLVADTPSFKEWVSHPAVNEQVRGDIQQLKQAMWHKNRPPACFAPIDFIYKPTTHFPPKTGEIAGKC